MIAPFDKMVDKQIRSLFEYEVVHRKANNFGIFGGILTLLRIKWFWAISYWYGARQKDGIERFLFSKKYARIYNTFAMFDNRLQEKYDKYKAQKEQEPDDTDNDVPSDPEAGAAALGGTRPRTDGQNNREDTISVQT
jgi:hypothetical protein